MNVRYSKGSVLSPMLFNMYTNDQPSPDEIEHFLYPDDLAIVAQGRHFTKDDEKLQSALPLMSTYYKVNSLKSNPLKTQVCAFH